MQKLEPFKYKFPIKHITLNELPNVLYPIPMKRPNYYVRELNSNKKTNLLNRSNYVKHSDDEENIKPHNRRNRPIKTLHSRSTQFESSIKKITPHKQQLVGQSSPEVRLKSETVKLCRMQSESSQETRDLIFKGQSITINLQDTQTIVATNHLGQIKPQDKQSINDHTLKYLSDNTDFVKSREIGRDKMRYRLYQYYNAAINSDNQKSKEYLTQQRQKFQEFVTPSKEIIKEQINTEVQSKPRRSYNNELARIINFEIDQKQDPKPRSQSQYIDSSEIVRSRNLKTEQHHRLISKLNAKTNDLVNQWKTFNIRDNANKNIHKLKEKQSRILRNSVVLNEDAQIKLRGDLVGILKMFKLSDDCK